MTNARARVERPTASASESGAAGAAPAAQPPTAGASHAAEQAVAGPAHTAVAAELAALRRRDPGRPLRVLDVGGGSGAWAVPLALAGCAVTVVDPSPNALAALQRRARDAGVADLVTPVPGDVDTLSDLSLGDGADLVLGHGLLEVVDDAAAAVRALATAAAPGGAVSLLVAGRWAAMLARTLAGRLDEARAVMLDPEGRTGPADALRRRLDAAGLRRMVEAAGLSVELLQGDGLLEGLVPAPVREEGAGAARAVGELERLGAAQPALLDVAARLHAIGRRG